MPNPEKLKDLRVPRVEPEKAGTPKLIKVAENFDLWFKQDDSFDVRQVWMQVKIQSNDCDYPYTIQSQLYS